MIPNQPFLDFLRELSNILVGVPSVAVSMLVLVGIKSVVGYHFPWERCGCCGQQWRHHDSNKANKCGRKDDEKDVS